MSHMFDIGLHRQLVILFVEAFCMQDKCWYDAEKRTTHRNVSRVRAGNRHRELQIQLPTGTAVKIATARDSIAKCEMAARRQNLPQSLHYLRSDSVARPIGRRVVCAASSKITKKMDQDNLRTLRRHIALHKTLTLVASWPHSQLVIAR